MANIKSCESCSKPPAEGISLDRCSRCKSVAYCDRECQIAHWPTHKTLCTPANFVLKVCLCPEEITNPPIWRTLSCPANASFRDLHRALQTAFGWSDTHCYDFKVKVPGATDKLPDMMSMMQRIQCMDAKPEGPSIAPRVNHLRIVSWSGRFPPIRYSAEGLNNRWRYHAQTPKLLASKTKLWKVFGDDKWDGCPFEYEYDFGDHWDNTVEIVGREDPTKSFLCKEGGGHPAAEDVGSSSGWERLIKAYRSRNPHREQREQMKWFESVCSNKDRMGLKRRENEWDMEEVNKALAGWTI